MIALGCRSRKGMDNVQAYSLLRILRERIATAPQPRQPPQSPDPRLTKHPPHHVVLVVLPGMEGWTVGSVSGDCKSAFLEVQHSAQSTRDDHQRMRSSSMSYLLRLCCWFQVHRSPWVVNHSYTVNRFRSRYRSFRIAPGDGCLRRQGPDAERYAVRLPTTLYGPAYHSGKTFLTPQSGCIRNMDPKCLISIHVTRMGSQSIALHFGNVAA